MTKLVNAWIIGTLITANRDITVHWATATLKYPVKGSHIADCNKVSWAKTEKGSWGTTTVPLETTTTTTTTPSGGSVQYYIVKVYVLGLTVRYLIMRVEWIVSGKKVLTSCNRIFEDDGLRVGIKWENKMEDYNGFPFFPKCLLFINSIWYYIFLFYESLFLNRYSYSIS